MEPDLSAMFSATGTGERPFEWMRANVLIRPCDGGIAFSDLESGRPIARHQGIAPRAWLSPAGDWLVFLSGDGLVAFDSRLRLPWRLRPFGEAIFALYFRPPFLVASTQWFDEGKIIDTVIELETGERLDELYGTEPWPSWRAFIDARLDQIHPRSM